MVRDTVRGRLALPAVGVGVLAVSAAAIFIRLAEAPAVAIAFWRCALGVALLLPAALVRRERFPRGKTLYIALASGVALGAHFGFWIGAITLGPQIMGHTVFNWALRYVEASIVSGTILAEPVVSALLAWLILSEKPGLPTILGGAVVLAGLFMLLRGYRIKLEPIA